MAYEEHLERIKQGVEKWNQWRLENPDVRPDLSDANLSDAKLSSAKLSRANLSGANLSSAKLWATVFADCDLSTVRGLESVHHSGPSYISIDTIYKSGGKIPDVFLRGAGVPDNFITYMHSLVGQAIQFFSCFISHSAKDKSFCERLYADLQAKGVRTWYFPEDAKWGEPVWGEIDRSIKVYDKLIVVCSENSLQSGPVQREINRALNREDAEGKGVLFPIRIDDYIFAKDAQGDEKWQHPRKDDVLAKVVGDFTGWHDSATHYQKSFTRLVDALKAEEPPKP